ncbi:SHOCT domain-containing protein, partial [Nitrospirota bacterium]
IMMGQGMYGFGGGLMMIAFWALLIIVAVYLFKMISGDGASRTASPIPVLSPTEVLLGRYARGELSREEFERIRTDIS